MKGTDIHTAAEWLKKGEVIAIPTETVYGLAANALNATAVAKIFEIKNRPQFNPLIVHIKQANALFDIAKNIDERLLKLFYTFSPGPLTILADKKPIIPDIVTAGRPRVAVRIPNHSLTLQLLHSIDFPLAAPSANPFQYISPTSAEQVAEQLGNKVPYILDGGKCAVGIESTIVGTENDEIIVYRLGGISIEEVEAVVGKVKLKNTMKESSEHSIDSPGQLKKHYAPKKPLIVGDIKNLLQEYSDKKVAVISFGKTDFARYPQIKEYNLSPQASLQEAASRLFETLYAIDQSDAEVILAQLVPDTDLGQAINDRLQRAAKESKQ